MRAGTPFIGLLNVSAENPFAPNEAASDVEILVCIAFQDKYIKAARPRLDPFS